MIAVCRRQWQSFDQKIHQGFHLVHVFASLLHLPYVAPELT